MSGGVIAIVVIICLLATAGGAVFLVMFFKRESRLKKLLGFDNQLPQRNVGSFDNVGYEESANSSS